MKHIELVGLTGLLAHRKDLEPAETLRLFNDFAEVSPLCFVKRLSNIDFEAVHEWLRLLLFLLVFIIFLTHLLLFLLCSNLLFDCLRSGFNALS